MNKPEGVDEMSWIPSDQSLLGHRKTGRLVRKLGISRIAAIGHLHVFWWWCMDNAPEGNLSSLEADDIADGASWEGDGQLFLDAMVYAGFIDDTPAGMEVHDWAEYGGKLINHRKADAKRTADRRSQKSNPVDVRTTSTGHNTDTIRTNTGQPMGVDKCPVVEEIRLEEIREEDRREEEEHKAFLNTHICSSEAELADREAAKPGKLPPPKHKPTEFKAFYAAYPRRDNPRDAAAAWDSVKPDDDDIDAINRSLSRFGGKPLSKEQAARCKQPGAWIRARRWESTDDFPGLTLEALNNPVGAAAQSGLLTSAEEIQAYRDRRDGRVAI